MARQAVSDQLALATAIEDAGIERGKAEQLAAMRCATLPIDASNRGDDP
jgi:hypothetical protein